MRTSEEIRGLIDYWRTGAPFTYDDIGEQLHEWLEIRERYTNLFECIARWLQNEHTIDLELLATTDNTSFDDAAPSCGCGE